MSQTLPLRSLSQREAHLLTELAAAGLAVFTVDDAQRVAGDEPDLIGLLHRLSTKRWLQRLERGKYRLIPLGQGQRPTGLNMSSWWAQPCSNPTTWLEGRH